MEAVVEKPKRSIYIETAINVDSSPYSLQSDPTQKLIDNLEFIPPTDEIFDENGDIVQIRYIARCPTIYVKEQIDKYKVPIDYGRSMSGASQKSRDDIIKMEKGALEVQPKQKNLIEYLQKCNYNGSNPNRNLDSMILFYWKDVVLKAKKEFDTLKNVRKAQALVMALEGNYEKLKDTAIVLHLDAGMTEQQLLLALDKMAQKNPDLIINTLAEGKATIDLVASKAMDFGIIEFTGTSYRYAGTESNIKGFQGRQKPDVAFKSLVQHLGSDEGHSDLLNIQKLIEAKAKN